MKRGAKVRLVKSNPFQLPTSIYYLDLLSILVFTYKNRLRYRRERASQSLEVNQVIQFIFHSHPSLYLDPRRDKLDVV